MKAYILLAEGFEEVEALTTADILFRAGINVSLVKVPSESSSESINEVSGAHKIKIIPDLILKKHTDIEKILDGDCIVLPGGMPGTTNLSASDACKKIIASYFDAGKTVAAICAAPSILGGMGLLKGKNATCFPGFESKLSGAAVSDAAAVIDGNIVTGKSMGSAVTFALKVVEALLGMEASDKVEASIYRG